jgi:outer membrane protein assembly factor BamC
MNNRSIIFSPVITRYLSITATVTSLLVLSACSSLETIMDNKVDYRSGSDNLNRNPLEIPPDLTPQGGIRSGQYTVPGATNYVDQTTTQHILATQSQAILPITGNNAKLVQDGHERWLTVNAPPEKVWPQIREFWLNQGFALEVDNPTSGILETDWLENRAKLPKDWVRKMLGKVIDKFMSTGEMDKYRTRIERGPNNTTEIFVSHRGMVEVFKNDGSAKRVATNEVQAETIWTPRPTDPSLEAEMLSLMLQQLGVKAEVAKSTIAHPEVKAVRTTLVEVGNDQALLVEDAFDRAWRRVGLALDRAGYIVVDRNRAEGVYYIRRASEEVAKEDKPGLLASLAFWKSKKKTSEPISKENISITPEFEVRLAPGKGSTTLVSVVATDKAGAKSNPSTVRNQLLTELK